METYLFFYSPFVVVLKFLAPRTFIKEIFFSSFFLEKEITITYNQTTLQSQKEVCHLLGKLLPATNSVFFFSSTISFAFVFKMLFHKK